jgi:hypothetical protein
MQKVLFSAMLMLGFHFVRGFIFRIKLVPAIRTYSMSKVRFRVAMNVGFYVLPLAGIISNFLLEQQIGRMPLRTFNSAMAADRSEFS